MLRTITEFPGHAWIGRISPDGQQIVFNMPAHSVSFADDGDGWINTRGWDIWTMNVDGTNKRIIIKGAGAGRVTCWSPDGTKFIYYREDHPNAQLKRYRNFVFDIKSEQATRLEFPENESVWDWSPDGKELLTVTEFQEEPGRQMFRVNFDGSNRVRLGRPNRTNLCRVFLPMGNESHFCRTIVMEETFAWSIVTGVGCLKSTTTISFAPVHRSGHRMASNWPRFAILEPQARITNPHTMYSLSTPTAATSAELRRHP